MRTALKILKLRDFVHSLNTEYVTFCDIHKMAAMGRREIM